MERVRIAVVGCGDVARRRYLPALAALEAVDVVACCDADAGRARAAAAAVGEPRAGAAAAIGEPRAGTRAAGAAPDPVGAATARTARAARDVAEVVASEPLDAVVNLTPPAAHAEVTAAAFEAGLHVYSEKPLATDLAAARGLAAQANAAGRLLLCAPAVMATTRFRWLRELLASGRLGRITLATGQISNLGPAAWPAYTGDVAAYYRPGAGPLVDQGVYVLHAIVGLLGPARRVQALAATALPERTSAAAGAPGARIAVEVADHWLIGLELAGGALAQVLSSFAAPASRAPLLELHGERGSISIAEAPPLTDAGPVDIHADGRWQHAVLPPGTPCAGDSLIGAGVAHFAGCLTGRERPVLTAAVALHVLEIARRAEEAAACGEALTLETTFPWP